MRNGDSVLIKSMEMEEPNESFLRYALQTLTCLIEIEEKIIIRPRGILLDQKGSNMAYPPQAQDFLYAQCDRNLKQNIVGERQHGESL